MTRADVEALLGPRTAGLSGPVVTLNNEPVIKLDEDALSDGIVRFGSEDQWISDSGAIGVTFNAKGHAEYKMWSDVTKWGNPVQRFIWRLRSSF
jgi:hypothetical protein